MELKDTISSAAETATVKRAFGEPFERGGVTLIPVARVSGGAGGGGGNGPDGQSRGEGSGFGVGVTPIGMFVIKGDQVDWRPAVDVNKVIGGSLVVTVVGLLTLRSLVRTLRGKRGR